MQVSDLLSVVSSLTVQVKFLMAFPKPSGFESIYKEFAVALLAFVVLVSIPVWKRETCFFFFLIILVQVRCTLLAVMLKCFL